MAAHGDDIILLGQDVEDMEKTAADLYIRYNISARVVAFNAKDLYSHVRVREEILALIKIRPIHIFLAFALYFNTEDLGGDVDALNEMVSVNCTGSTSILMALSPILAEQKEGKLVVLSSVAGDLGRAKNYVYGATKAYINKVTEGMAAELSKANIQTYLVKPGPIDTAMSYGLKVPFKESPEKLGEFLDYITQKKPGGTFYFPKVWWPIMMLLRHLPWKRRLKLKI